MYGGLKRKCDKCGSRVSKQCSSSEDRPKKALFDCKYLSIGESSQSNHRHQQMGEPVLLNPNSYDNLRVILDSLKVNLDIGNTRHWSFIGCDGPPYCLASRLVEQNKTVYDWISLVPGLGHLNMNQLKTLFKVCIRLEKSFT